MIRINKYIYKSWIITLCWIISLKNKKDKRNMVVFWQIYVNIGLLILQVNMNNDKMTVWQWHNINLLWMMSNFLVKINIKCVVAWTLNAIFIDHIIKIYIISLKTLNFMNIMNKYKGSLSAWSIHFPIVIPSFIKRKI